MLRALVVATSLALCSVALAQPRVAITTITGTGDLTRQVEDAFLQDGRFAMVSSQEARQATREVGNDAAMVAEHLGAWVVSGHTRRIRRDFVTTLLLTNPSGEREATATFRGRNLGSLQTSLRRAPDRLFEGIEIEGGGSEAYEDEAAEPEPESEAPADDPGDGELDDEPLFGDEDDTDGAEEPDADAGHGAGAATPHGLTIALRAGLLRRSMQTTVVADGRYSGMGDGTPITEQRAYTSPGAGQPHLALVIDLFPGALLANPVAPWIGARVRLGGASWLNTRATACEGEPRCELAGVVDVPTKQRSIEGSLMARFTFDGGHYIGGEAGVGSFGFRFDIPTLAQLERTSITPSVIYRYVRLGIEGGAVVVPDHLELSARVAYLLGIGLNNDAKATWGVNSAALGGVDFGLTIRSPLNMVLDGLFIGLYLDVILQRTRYQGQTLCTVQDQTLCGDPNANALWEPWPAADGIRGLDVQGGISDPVSDLYIRFGLELGFRFGGGSTGGGAASNDEEAEWYEDHGAEEEPADEGDDTGEQDEEEEYNEPVEEEAPADEDEQVWDPEGDDEGGSDDGGDLPPPLF